MKIKSTTRAAIVATSVLFFTELAPFARSQAAPSGLQLPANTWQDAKLTYLPPEGVGDAKWSTTDGYCSSLFRSKTGTILGRTGVSSKTAGWNPGFYSNATLEWNPTSQEARVIEVANWGGGSYGGGALLPAFEEHPTPTPRHTYDGMAYVEPEDAMYFILGANWRIAAKSEGLVKETFEKNNRVTWKYSFADKRWTAIPSHISQHGFRGSPYESHLQWWPERKRLIFLDDVARFYAEFDLETQKWTKQEMANKSPMSLYNARSTWDSKRQRWVFRLGPKACYFDPVKREFTELPAVYEPPVEERDPRRSIKGIVYIPKHDVYLATGRNGNDTWVFHIDRGVWENIQGGDIDMPNGYPQYDPANDLVVNVYQLQAFRFRYAPKP